MSVIETNLPGAFYHWIYLILKIIEGFLNYKNNKKNDLMLWAHFEEQDNHIQNTKLKTLGFTMSKI